MKRMTPTLLMSACVVSLAMIGCMVGPKYHRPDVATPSVFRDLANDRRLGSIASGILRRSPWWQVFEDPELQELIRMALKENYDLELATERIDAARAQVALTRSSLFPQVQGDATFNGGKDKHSVQVQFSWPDCRCRISVGPLRPPAPRDRGLSRPTFGNRGRPANGHAHPGKRSRQ